MVMLLGLSIRTLFGLSMVILFWLLLGCFEFKFSEAADLG